MATVENFTFQIDRIIYANAGFHIAATVEGDKVQGKFKASEGSFFTAKGAWDKTSPNAKRYGPTFKIEVASEISPTDNNSLCKFLVRKFKGQGLGEGFFDTVLTACNKEGLKLERLLDTSDQDLLVKFVGSRHQKKVAKLLSGWPDLKPQADLVSPLMGYGLSEAQANSLVDIWGRNALDRLRQDPYGLIHVLSGISFLRADRIAMKIGKIKPADPIRLRAGFATGLRDATSNGDLGVRRSTLIRSTKILVNDAVTVEGKRVLDTSVPLKVSEAQLKNTLDLMLSGEFKEDNGELCKFSAQLVQSLDEKGKEVIWLKPLLQAEDKVVAALNRLCAPAREDLVATARSLVAAQGASLAPEQWEAIQMVFRNPVSIITGGPGCGKTFIQKLLLDVFKSDKTSGNLAAPSGKAAKRMAEATGHPASTIHSLIKYSAQGKALFNEGNPLESGFLILDEMSMSDIELTAAVLSAAKPTCRVIIVGDVDQLASVGPGQVLRDMIRSERVPYTRLTKGFRFGKGSDIAKAARAVNRGMLPKDKGSESAFELVETDDPKSAMLSRLEELLSKGVPMGDILILSPTNKGRAGCEMLNQGAQSILNPASLKKVKGQCLPRDAGDIYVNDRVIQNKNDYDLGLVNGDLGWIEEIQTNSGKVFLSLQDGDRQIEMERNQTINLKLAYAITIHKSQGSEAPYVLMAIDSAAAFMLRRNLIYTGITRASKKVIVFASSNTLTHAIRIGEPAEGRRRTMLCAKLKESLLPVEEAATGGEISFNQEVGDATQYAMPLLPSVTPQFERLAA